MYFWESLTFSENLQQVIFLFHFINHNPKNIAKRLFLFCLCIFCSIFLKIFFICFLLQNSIYFLFFSMIIISRHVRPFINWSANYFFTIIIPKLPTSSNCTLIEKSMAIKIKVGKPDSRKKLFFCSKVDDVCMYSFCFFQNKPRTFKHPGVFQR